MSVSGKSKANSEKKKKNTFPISFIKGEKDSSIKSNSLQKKLYEENGGFIKQYWSRISNYEKKPITFLLLNHQS